RRPRRVGEGAGVRRVRGRRVRALSFWRGGLGAIRPDGRTRERRPITLAVLEVDTQDEVRPACARARLELREHVVLVVHRAGHRDLLEHVVAATVEEVVAPDGGAGEVRLVLAALAVLERDPGDGLRAEERRAALEDLEAFGHAPHGLVDV